MNITHHNPTPTDPKRVVILGANGFVARELAQALAAEKVPHTVIGSAQVDLLAPDASGKLSGLLKPDDALVITSALTPEKGKDVRTFMKNLTMIEHVCAALDAVRCSQVIYLSSDAVYDDADPLVRETTPLTGLGLYGLMHVAREKMLEFVAAGKTPIPFCIVRPCAIYGAADTHSSYGPNRFMRTALKDRKITMFGNGEEQRDHIYIRDVVRFLLLCLRHRSEGAVNIVSGRAVSFGEIADSIARLSPQPVQIEKLARGPGSVITHRHFDISLRLRVFPDFHSTPLDAGLAESWRELTA
jgi:nucleoside-diphosphate-sugar epimerase